MKNLELKFGPKLTKDEMRKITGGVGGSGECPTCTDGEVNPITTNDVSALANTLALWLGNDQIDGYACSDGEGGGDMSGCPI